jgi:hypothetical protein
MSCVSLPLPCLAAGRVERVRLSLRVPIVARLCSFALGHTASTFQEVASTRGADPLCSGHYYHHLHNIFLAEATLGLVACTLVTACLVCLGVRRVWMEPMEPVCGTDPEGDKQPTPRSSGKHTKRHSKSASAASHLPSPDIRTFPLTPFPIHHLSSFVRSLIFFFSRSSLASFPHLPRTRRTSSEIFFQDGSA